MEQIFVVCPALKYSSALNIIDASCPLNDKIQNIALHSVRLSFKQSTDFRKQRAVQAALGLSLSSDLGLKTSLMLVQDQLYAILNLIDCRLSFSQTYSVLHVLDAK